jgi:hypothetical protein
LRNRRDAPLGGHLLHLRLRLGPLHTFVEFVISRFGLDVGVEKVGADFVLDCEDLLEDYLLVSVCDVLELGIELVIDALQICSFHLLKRLVFQRRVPFSSNPVAEHHGRRLYFHLSNALFACADEIRPTWLLLDVTPVVAIVRTVVVMIIVAQMLTVQGVVDDL